MANEKRLIDANPIVKFIMDGLNNHDKLNALGHDAIEVLAEIEYAPTVDAVEVAHAQWEPYAIQPNGFVGSYRCTACGNTSINDSNYCPNCGAKMDGGNEDV